MLLYSLDVAADVASNFSDESRARARGARLLHGLDVHAHWRCVCITYTATIMATYTNPNTSPSFTNTSPSFTINIANVDVNTVILLLLLHYRLL